MADISSYLAAIMAAVYGEDVRGSIHDAIELINDVSEVVMTTGTAVTGPTSSSTGFYSDSLYLNTNTMELWKCVGTNSWQSQGTLKGADGDPGNGIVSITKTSTSGLVDTYTILFTDGNSTTFNVTNGADGQDGQDGRDGTNGSVWYKGTAIDGTGSSITGFPGNLNDFYLNATTGNVYNCTQTGTALTALWDYVMTLTGGGGSSVTVVDNLNSTSSTDALSANMGHTINNPTITEAGSRTNIATGDNLPTIFGKIKKFFADLHSVAFSGSYSDLSNQPTIPTVTDTYSGTSSDGMSGKAVKSAIDALDVTTTGAATNKTITALSQTDGKISATFSNISITKSQISDFPTIPTVNNSTITIQRSGTTVDTFTTNASSNKTINILDDYWTSTATVDSNNQVTFSGLNDNYGYDLYCQNKLIGISEITKTGSGTSTTLKYTVTGATTGDTCKLRVLR